MHWPRNAPAKAITTNTFDYYFNNRKTSCKEKKDLSLTKFPSTDWNII